MTREPSVIIGTITGVVAATLALIVAFGVDITQDQQTAILGLVAALAPIAAGLIIRGKVTPVIPDGTGEHRAGGFTRPV